MGAKWGENGYIKLARGVAGAGQCGILEMASYPVVTGSIPPSPKPAPTPTPVPPPPSPAPVPPAPSDSCVLQPTEEQCLATSENGKPCGWCVLDLINMSFCVEPGFECAAAPPVPEPEKTNSWVLPVALGVTVMGLGAVVASLGWVWRRKAPLRRGDPLNVSLQETHMAGALA